MTILSVHLIKKYACGCMQAAKARKINAFVLLWGRTGVYARKWLEWLLAGRLLGDATVCSHARTGLCCL